jgi:UDP-N-acetylmuramyl pentapeptide phosphotransferase/UDP-N-acetylglucosamine-1-phosphate transferase
MKASVMDRDELSVLVSQGSVAGGEELAPTLDRRAVRDRRRRERRLRRLYTLGGLAVLAAFLVATVVVVDMVR